jgi:Tfp pilus assembly protein PilO
VSARPAPRPFWRRFLLWPAVGLLGLNLGAFFAYTVPRRLQERTLAAQAVTLREEVARERQVNGGLRKQAQVIGTNTQDMHRFLREVVAERDSLSTVLEELERTARESGLRTQQRNYKREEVDKLGLVRFEVTLPLLGTDPQLMSFLDALERSPRFVTVDRVKYQNREGDAPGLSLLVSAYFARGAASGG